MWRRCYSIEIARPDRPRADHTGLEWNRNHWGPDNQLLPDPLIGPRMEAGAKAQQVESTE
jgi:hypothetical protein